MSSSDTITSYIHDIDIATRQKDYLKALEHCKAVRNKFPDNHTGYSRAAWILIEMGEYEKAEELCQKGIMASPDNIAPYIHYADSATRQKDYLEALERWKTVQDKFPDNHTGYSRAAWVLLEMREYEKAEKLCQKNIMTWPDTITSYIHYADSATRQKDFPEALKRWKTVRDKFPDNHTGYSRAAWILIEMRKYEKAEELCRQGIKGIQQSAEILMSYAQISIHKKYFIEAKMRLINCVQQINLNKNIYHQIINSLLICHDFEYAQYLCNQLIKYNYFDIKNHLLNINISFKNISLSFEKKLADALRKVLDVYCFFPKHPELTKLLLNIFYHLSSYENIFKIKHRFLLSNLLISDMKEKNNDNSRIAFFSESANNLSYYAPILKHINCNKLDIIILRQSQQDKSIFLENNIINFNLYYDISCLKNYMYVVCEENMYKYLDKKNNIIAVQHSQEHIFGDKLENIALVIYQTEKQAKINTNLIFDDEKDILTKHNSKNLCEICYTGTFHLSGWFKKTKQELYKQINEKYNFCIPSEKPLVFVLGDEISNFGQLVYMIKKISKFCTVVFKPWYGINSPLLKKIPNNVLVLTEKKFANNLFRFAADFILVGYTSGSFITSLMTGQNVIPYYSRLVKFKAKKTRSTPLWYKNFIPDIEDNFNSNLNPHGPQKIILNEFYNSSNLFDLLNIQRLKRAILETEYLNWYKKNLKDIQEKAFEGYLLENAAKMTADYIMCYAENGTLGNKCKSIYLKKNCFCNNQ